MTDEPRISDQDLPRYLEHTGFNGTIINTLALDLRDARQEAKRLREQVALWRGFDWEWIISKLVVAANESSEETERQIMATIRLMRKALTETEQALAQTQETRG